jgi:hypothetical protein
MPPPPLRFYGDEAILPAVEHALSRLPAPVRDLVIGECYFIAVGGRLRGWTSAPLATANLCPIVVSGSEFGPIVQTVLHEAAHRWHASPLVSERTQPTAAEYAALLAYATREAWPLEAHARAVAEEERLVDLLAGAWIGGE